MKIVQEYDNRLLSRNRFEEVVYLPEEGRLAGLGVAAAGGCDAGLPGELAKLPRAIGNLRI